MAVTVVLELNIQPDKADEFEKYLGSILVDTRARPGFQSIVTHRNTEDPAAFLAYEVWDSRADYEAYLGWRTENGSMATIGSYLAGPPSIRYFTTSDI
ncbi:MAG: putative quinol monooxygenase [Sporichthyaceae bacterium]